MPSTTTVLLFVCRISWRHLLAMAAGPSSSLSFSMVLPMFSGVGFRSLLAVSFRTMSPIMTTGMPLSWASRLRAVFPEPGMPTMPMTFLLFGKLFFLLLN